MGTYVPVDLEAVGDGVTIGEAPRKVLTGPGPFPLGVPAGRPWWNGGMVVMSEAEFEAILGDVDKLVRPNG